MSRKQNPQESKGNDMDPSWKEDVKFFFKKAIHEEGFSTENEIAKYLQEIIQNKRKGLWHCIVGKSYGSAVVFEEKTHFYEQLGQFQVEIWRCG